MKKNCCKSNGLWKGIGIGLIPHIGCILFIVASILGATVLVEFFKPILMNEYFFYILILVSIAFASLSSIIYLKKNNLLSKGGITKKWKYLGLMYGSTIGINILLFLVIFPVLTNVSAAPITGLAVNNEDLIKLKVDIPCPGHAPLIKNELMKLSGVINVKFSFPNLFEVSYDITKTSKESILNLDIFKEFKAEEDCNKGIVRYENG